MHAFKIKKEAVKPLPTNQIYKIKQTAICSACILPLHFYAYVNERSFLQI